MSAEGKLGIQGGKEEQVQMCEGGNQVVMKHFESSVDKVSDVRWILSNIRDTRVWLVSVLNLQAQGPPYVETELLLEQVN